MKTLKNNYLMWFIVFGLMLSLGSCQKYKKEIVKLNASKDSVMQVVNDREGTIIEYMSSFNEIQDRLDSIKTLQKIMSVELSGSNQELKEADKDKIIEDITMLNDLINKNKNLVASLRKKLSDSNLKIAELEKMLVSMTKQIEEKDGEIVALNNEIQSMKIDISQLNLKVEELTTDTQIKAQTIEKQKSELNSAYYCFGTKDELLANNVIEKTGGLIGIGQSLQMKDNFNHDYFMKVDIREFNEVMLMVKKATLLTVHPDSSYHFTGEEKAVEGLVIDNPKEFWSATKYMVILVELNKK